MQKHRGHKARVYVVVLSILGAYAGLFGRLCMIQGMGGDQYRALAEAQHVTTVRLLERRGTIYDCRGRELAVSVKVPSIFANPGVISDRAAASRRLAKLLRIDGGELLARLERRMDVVCLRRGLTEGEQQRLRERPLVLELGPALSIEKGAVYAYPERVLAPRVVAEPLGRLLGLPEKQVLSQLQGLRPFVWVKRKVSEDERSAVTSASDLEGIGVAWEYKRKYPHKLAPELVGFVGIDENGLEGMELALDEILAGQEGHATFRRDAAGRFISDPALARDPASPGEDVELSIDTVIQTYAEQALEEAWDLWAPKSAAAIVLDPATGDVLAAASLPTFDPNRYAELDPATLKRNCRAHYIVDWFEPGSVMKAFVLSAALAERVVTEDNVIFCENGVWILGSRPFHDHIAYGDLTVAEVIIKSSNIGAAKIGGKVGAERLYRYLKAFGLGTPTGFPLPGENPGLLRPPSKWTSLSLPSISVGQEVCVNLLQLGLAYATIANDGVRMRPRLVRRFTHEDGLWSERPPQPVGRVIPASIAQRVRQVLFRVIEEGTGKPAKLALYTAGGKTGTAQKPAPGGGYSHSKVVCTFVGMAPADHPRIVVLVSLDEPTKTVGGRHYGGTVAAPPVGTIINRTLAYLGVKPDKPQLAARPGAGDARER